MKKRYWITPVIVIIAALVLGALVTVFTTPVSFYVTRGGYTMTFGDSEEPVITEPDDYFFHAKKVGKLMQIVCKINPSVENIETLAEIYSPYNYIHGTYKGHTAPSDYLEKSVKATKMQYELDYDEQSVTYAIPVGAGEGARQARYKMNNGLEYAKALYLNGQIEESEKTMDEIIDIINPQIKREKGIYIYDEDFVYTSILSFRDYFYLVYSTAESDEVKAWVLKAEDKAINMAINTDIVYKPNSQVNKYLTHHDVFFTNPDYESYVNYNWPESERDWNNSEIYIDYFSELRKNPEQYPGTCDSNEYYKDGVEVITEKGKETVTRFLDAKLENGEYTLNDNINEIVKVNPDGSNSMVFRLHDGEIRYTYVIGDIIWFLGGDTIYRLFTPTDTVDAVYEGVKVTSRDARNYFSFLYPISNYEIEWIEAWFDETHGQYIEKAFYYYSPNNVLITKENYIGTAWKTIDDSIRMPERNWWNEGDALLKTAKPSVSVAITRSWDTRYENTKTCRQKEISYYCYPSFERDAATDEEMKNIETIWEYMDDFFNMIHENGQKIPNYKYYIEMKYENVGNETVLTFKGEHTDVNTGELVEFNKVARFNFIVTDEIKNLNSFDNNYFHDETVKG